MLKTESYSINGELFDIGENVFSANERLNLQTYQFYDYSNIYQYVEGGIIKTRYAMCIDGLWSEWSDTHITTVKGFAKVAINNVSVPDVVENGKDFTVSFSFNEHIDHFYVNLMDDNGRYVCGDSFTVNQESGDFSVQISSKELTAGEYFIEIHTSPVDNWLGSSLVYRKEITVTGYRKRGPNLEADKQEIHYDETLRLTVYAPGCVRAYVCGQESNESTFWSEYIELDENGRGEAIYTNWYSSNMILLFKATAYEEDAWSNWSTPLSISAVERPVLDAPVIHAPTTLIAGQDFTFSFDEVENATNYYTDLRASNDVTVYYGYEASPTDLNTVPGYLMKTGEYTLSIEANAAGYDSSYKSQSLTVTGSRPRGPEVTVEEPLRVKQDAVFTIATEEAEGLQVKYEFKNDHGWWYEDSISIPVTGNSTQWVLPIYDEKREVTSLDISFSIKKKGIWSQWKTNTYTIEGRPPLDSAVIHVDNTIEAGKDFSITVDPVENATRYEYIIYQSNRYYKSGRSDTTVNLLRFNGYDFDAGTYIRRICSLGG